MEPTAIRNAAQHSRTGLWFIAVTLAGILLLVLSQLGVVDPLRSAVSTVLSPLTSLVDAAAEAVTGDSGANQSDLEAEIESLQNEIALLRQQAGRADELADALGFVEQNRELETVTAEVEQANSTDFEDLLTVNRGKSDGVIEDMMVLSPQGSLVGRVVRAYDDYSWVRLITDPASTVDAIIQGPNIDGVVQGDGGDDLAMSLVPKGFDVRPGYQVVTLGLSGRFLPGILLGVVNDVSESDELFLAVTVTPAAKLDGLDVVLIVTDPIPQRVEPPEE